MNKELLEESIKNVVEGLKTSKENKERAEQHIEEGEVILAALNAELEKL